MANFSRPLLALIIGQVCLHSCMTGVRVAAPLLALRQGQAQWAVGILLGLFAAAPVLLSMRAGRLADRHGYHFPMQLAVALTTAGGLLAVASTWLTELQFPVLCLAATLCGVGANFGLIAIQRTAGRMTSGSSVELTRVFSWLGLAPAFSNMVGPVVAGVMIDVVRWLAEPDRYCAHPENRPRHHAWHAQLGARLVFHSALSDVRRVFHFSAGGNQSPAV